MCLAGGCLIGRYQLRESFSVRQETVGRAEGQLRNFLEDSSGLQGVICSEIRGHIMYLKKFSQSNDVLCVGSRHKFTFYALYAVLNPIFAHSCCLDMRHSSIYHPVNMGFPCESRVSLIKGVLSSKRSGVWFEPSLAKLLNEYHVIFNFIMK